MAHARVADDEGVRPGQQRAIKLRPVTARSSTQTSRLPHAAEAVAMAALISSFSDWKPGAFWEYSAL